MAELPFHPDTLTPEAKKIYESMVAERKKHGAPFGGPYDALMNHPALCQKIEALGGYLKFQGHLVRDVYQFVVLAVAQHTKTAFEWVDHLPHALAAGLPEEVIQTLKIQGIQGVNFPEQYQLAANILQYTLAFKSIPLDLQTAAIQSYGMYGFIEIVVLSGFYQMFSAINQGFDVPLNPNTPSPF